MLSFLRRTFWVPYPDSYKNASILDAQEAIKKYCESNGDDYSFLTDNIVLINDIPYEIIRTYEGRGNYGIKCRRLSK